jgi:hypothetical protein
MSIFFNIAVCSLVEVGQCFKGACCLHHQGDELTMEAVNISETSVNFGETTRRYIQEGYLFI